MRLRASTAAIIVLATIMAASCSGSKHSAVATRTIRGELEGTGSDQSMILDVAAVAEDVATAYEAALASAVKEAEERTEKARRPVRERLQAAERAVRERRDSLDAAIPDQGLWLPEYTATGISLEEWRTKQPGVPELRAALKSAERDRDLLRESLQRVGTAPAAPIPWPHAFASMRSKAGTFQFEIPRESRRFMLLARDVNRPAIAWKVWVAPQGQETLVTLSESHLNATVANMDPGVRSPSEGGGGWLALGGLFLVCLGLVLYFLPTLIAAKREHHNTIAIFALNFLAGWTVLGWIGAFVWSLTSQPRAASR